MVELEAGLEKETCIMFLSQLSKKCKGFEKCFRALECQLAEVKLEKGALQVELYEVNSSAVNLKPELVVVKA